VFQRDIRFESLTQAERRVVYAARDYARYRKTLFVNLADSYYSLLLTYRAIEIAAQDYFSNLRGFYQAEADRDYRDLAPFQVDQFEQRALTSRRSLITACNALEQSLDRLKLQMGLPPELPLNLDLTELDELTLRDETTAAAERVRRAQRRLVTARSRPDPQQADLLNEAIRLIKEAISLQQLRQRRGEEVSGLDALETRLAIMQAEEARLRVDFKREVLLSQKNAPTPPPELLLISRTLDLIRSLLDQAKRELVVAHRTGADPTKLKALVAEVKALEKDHADLVDKMHPEKDETAQRSPDRSVELARKMLKKIPELTRRSNELLPDAEGVALNAESLMPRQAVARDEQLADILQQVDQLISQSKQLLGRDIGGLVPIEIDVDDAMLTALTLRYDVANEREQMADAWRRVKLTADDLKSFLNLNASQSIRTASDMNRPFDFTFDDSTTRLSVTLDAPLNRKRQRNLYRRQLINYNRAFRNLMALEDDIKFSVRSDLRQLSLEREQYRIAVSSAALAYDRVVSTRLQYQKPGKKSIRAQDVLEAQQDYTRSLVQLANAHINYIQRRTSLFLELELLTVDDSGFWPELYDERYQPTPNYELPEYSMPPYGELPPCVWYSKKVKRMLHVPPGQSMIFQPENNASDDAEVVPTPDPTSAEAGPSDGSLPAPEH